jgi:hypothetical protein
VAGGFPKNLPESRESLDNSRNGSIILDLSRSFSVSSRCLVCITQYTSISDLRQGVKFCIHIFRRLEMAEQAPAGRKDCLILAPRRAVSHVGGSQCFSWRLLLFAKHPIDSQDQLYTTTVVHPENFRMRMADPTESNSPNSQGAFDDRMSAADSGRHIPCVVSRTLSTNWCKCGYRLRERPGRASNMRNLSRANPPVRYDWPVRLSPGHLVFPMPPDGATS